MSNKSHLNLSRTSSKKRMMMMGLVTLVMTRRSNKTRKMTGRTLFKRRSQPKMMTIKMMMTALAISMTPINQLRLQFKSKLRASLKLCQLTKIVKIR